MLSFRLLLKQVFGNHLHLLASNCFLDAQDPRLLLADALVAVIHLLDDAHHPLELVLHLQVCLENLALADLPFLVELDLVIVLCLCEGLLAILDTSLCVLVYAIWRPIELVE